MAMSILSFPSAKEKSFAMDTCGAETQPPTQRHRQKHTKIFLRSTNVELQQIHNNREHWWGMPWKQSPMQRGEQGFRAWEAVEIE